ncbi:MAG: DUF998 domain-containing protein [Chitinophagaceae bacterium]|nr:DUF998 domain-containing protein [Chitinophagaceae bacterium]
MITALLLVIIIYLGGGIVYFAAHRPGYSHIRNTISELGEDFAPNRKMVNMGLFLPVGFMLLVTGLFIGTQGYGKELALCIGAGYLISALFPCDPGSPFVGSGKQVVHNIAGIIEYGGGIYFMHKSGHPLFALVAVEPQWITGILILCIALTPFPEWKLRGLFQRIMEMILFCQLLWIVSH